MTEPASNQTASSVGLANRLFRAIEAGDTETMRAVCNEDMVACQNNGPSMDFEAHMVCVTLPDGSVIRIPACVVGDVWEGRITRTMEYMDTGAAAALIRAISATISDGSAFR